MISVKGKEKQFYLSILSDFLLKIDNNKEIMPKTLNFLNSSMQTTLFITE